MKDVPRYRKTASRFYVLHPIIIASVGNSMLPAVYLNDDCDDAFLFSNTGPVLTGQFRFFLAAGSNRSYILFSAGVV
jgi:hypothetical protein